MKNIIFDIGNVLVDWDWLGYCRKLFDDEEVINMLTRAFWVNELWREMDRGAISQETIHRELLNVAALSGHEKEMEIAYSRLGECITPFSYPETWIKELQEKGYRVYFLSNYSTYLIGENPEALDFTKLMDGGIFSCDVKLLKPDLAIYALLCERYSLTPSECLFLDDKPINVIAAKEFGMHAIVFEGYEKTRPLVDAYLEEH